MNLNVSNLLNQRIDHRQTNWEKEFEKSSKAFSEEISAKIAQEVLSNLDKTLSDPYVLIPSKQSPLQYKFSFEIVNPHTAKRLKEMAQESGNLPPFKEWFKRFCASSDQKVSLDNSTFDSAPRLPFGKVFVQPESEKGIDKEYFQDMMSLSAKIVEKELIKTFKEITSKAENPTLKIQVKWYRKAEQSVEDTNLKDNNINILAWIEEKQSPASSSQPMSEGLTNVRAALQLQKTVRHRSQFNRTMITVASYVAIVAVLVVFMKAMDRII